MSKNERKCTYECKFCIVNLARKILSILKGIFKKMKIYQIVNNEINFWNRPFFAENDSEAISYIQNILMSDADRALIGLRDHLSLYCTGEYNSMPDQYAAEYDFAPSIIGCDPVHICRLDFIFDSIPADRVPRTAVQLKKSIDDQADLFKKSVNLLSEKIDTLDDCFKELYDFVSNLDSSIPDKFKKSRKE